MKWWAKIKHAAENISKIKVGLAIFTWDKVTLRAKRIKWAKMILQEEKYTKSPTYERVLFWEHVRKSNLFVSPIKIA